MTSKRPAVIDGLDVNEVKDGLVVYESASDRVHYLNVTASIVFTLCDGTHTQKDMAEVIRVTFDLDLAPKAEVGECVDTLAREGLIR